MNVAVDLAAGPAEVSLEEPDENRSFKVVVRGPGSDRALAAALEPIGNVDARGTASLRIAAVKALAGRRTADASWLRSFDLMIEYALTGGWVDPEREYVQAHCEHE